MRKPKYKPGPYQLILVTLLFFCIYAFGVSSPRAIWAGLGHIFTARGLLVSDFIEIGGLGAALLNAALSGLVFIGLTSLSKVKPSGSTLMALLLIVGFSFFGKTVFNMAPVFFGVWLYARFQKEPFINYSLVALLSSTLCPVVTEFAFGGRHPNIWVNVLVGIAFGTGAGFLMPIISAATNRVHGGYNLYNIGFAGGLVAMFIVAFGKSVSLQFAPAVFVSSGNNLALGILVYSVMLFWCLAGILIKCDTPVLRAQTAIMSHSGRLVTDFYLLYGENAYFNMGLMGLLGTTVVLLLGGDLNGLTLAGIFTMMGFGSFGKHPRNSIPVMAGAVLWAYINHASPTQPSNILAILFCTCLAPISGQYGWPWGVLAGVLHCGIVAHVGQVTGGLNLYSNGFAAGFVALVLVPVILAFKRRDMPQ